jgi:hypothetical protein
MFGHSLHNSNEVTLDCNLMASGGASAIIGATSGPTVTVKPSAMALLVLPHLLALAALSPLKVVGEGPTVLLCTAPRVTGR